VLNYLHQATAPHLVHHAAHLLVLIEQAVDLLRLLAGAGRDAEPAAGLQQVRLAALQRHH